MSMFEKFDGRYLLLGDQQFRVLGLHPSAPVYVLEGPEGTEVQITVGQFRELVREGKVSEGREADFSVFRAHDDQAREMAFRRAVLEDFASMQAAGKALEEIMPALRRKFAEDPRFKARKKEFPSKRTIQKWRENFQKMGSKSLIDRRFESGDRLPRYDAVFEDIVLDLLERSYMRSDRYTLDNLAKEAAALYKAHCEKHGIKNLKAYGRKAVESIISRIPHSDIVKGRIGSKEAQKRLIQAARFQDIRYAFDRIEIDSTRANIFVYVDGVDDPVRPWVTLAIDAATGFIVGLYISMEAPSNYTSASVMYQVMTGPDDRFFEKYGIENRVSVFGLPLTVVADQGAENGGEYVDRMLSVAGFEQQKNIPGKPEKKPFVERAIRTLKLFISELPGTTQTAEMPAKERTEKALREAMLSFDQFCIAVQRWRFDKYGKSKRRKVQSPLAVAETPTEAWQRLSRSAFVPEPPSKSTLARMFFCRREQRALHHYGIEIGRVQYSSYDLRYLYKDRKIRNVNVWVNPADIRQVAVEIAGGSELLFVKAKDPDLPAISVEERDRLLAARKTDVDAALTTQEILKGLGLGDHHKPNQGKTRQRIADHDARKALRDKHIANPDSAATTNKRAKSADISPSFKVPKPKGTTKISKEDK